jgi:hypothetical protein
MTATPGEKVCAYCGKPFDVDPKYPANFKRQKFCGNVCAQAAKKHSPERVRASFWSMVDKTGDCWLWTGYRQPDGYGQFRANSKFYNSHKFAYELAYGPVPDGLEVMHTCDQPHCCNVAHMRLGTHLENMQDCKAKGRQACGERIKRNKLTADQVLEIRRLFKRTEANRSNIPILAKRYGVFPGTIRDIILRLSWTHLA